MGKFIYRVWWSLIVVTTLVIFTLFSSACNENYPESRSFIITDRSSFEEIIIEDFKGFEVDFDKEMLLVYTFTTEYVLPAKIADMELNDKTLTVNYNIQLVMGAGSARRPFQRWFIVKLNKLDILYVNNVVSTIYTTDENLRENILPYDAVLFDDCGQWIKEKFQENNRVNGAVYE